MNGKATALARTDPCGSHALQVTRLSEGKKRGVICLPWKKALALESAHTGEG